MSHDTRRLTLVSRDARTPDRDWNSTSLVVLDSIRSGLTDGNLDVERILLDRSASAADYLALLADLPNEFRGDVVYIRENDSAFLSSCGRGGDRIIYALSAVDLRFYLETNDLVTGRIAPQSSPVLPIFERELYQRPTHAA